MKKISLLTALILATVSLYAEKKSIESIKNTDIKFEVKSDIALPAVSVKKDAKVGQDVSYKFNQVKDALWRIKSDTTWLRSDIQRLESDAKRIAQGQQNYWFQNDLRNMAYKMSQWYNDIQRISYDVKDLLKIAEKDKDLNAIARDIQWYANDIENTFRFDVENAAQNLEYTVRAIDPKIIGYDAQWNASDISRYARDISYKTQDLYWDTRDLLNKTQP